jgi:hypothetical protein
VICDHFYLICINHQFFSNLSQIKNKNYILGHLERLGAVVEPESPTVAAGAAMVFLDLKNHKSPTQKGGTLFF